MNKTQLTMLVILPALKEIPKGYTEEAMLAVSMIIAHESQCGHFIKQYPTGPALGPIQMEPRTHDDTWKHGDSIWRNALLMDIILIEEYEEKRHPPAKRLLYDMRYNVFMARQRLFMKTEALPKTGPAISKYLKKHWNSTLGAAGSDQYHEAFVRWSDS